MEETLIYKGISEAEHHITLTGVKWNRAELLKWFCSFPAKCHLPWNEYKRKYIPNNKYQQKLTDDFKMIYAPNWEGKELIEYPIIKNLIKQFNFSTPLRPADVQILTYEPGFAFVPHVDLETNLNIMFPILPESGGERLTFHIGTNFIPPDGDAYKVYYSTEHPTMTNGNILHSVETVKEYRAVLRIRTGFETYEDLLKKHKNNNLVKQ